MIIILKPNIKLERITDITPEILKKHNIKALILDVDNTLSTHHGNVLVEGLENWLSVMRDNNIPLIILSNSKEQRVKPFAEGIGLSYISLGLKPLPFGFIKASKRLGMKIRNTAIVGDQIFTDVLGGNCVGLKTVLLTPILLETSAGFKFKRWLERIVIKLLKIN